MMTLLKMLSGLIRLIWRRPSAAPVPTATSSDVVALHDNHHLTPKAKGPTLDDIRRAIAKLEDRGVHTKMTVTMDINVYRDILDQYSLNISDGLGTLYGAKIVVSRHMAPGSVRIDTDCDLIHRAQCGVVRDIIPPQDATA